MPLFTFYFSFLPFSPFSSLVLPVFTRFPSATCHLLSFSFSLSLSLSLSTLSTLPLAVYFPRPRLPYSSPRPEWHAARNLTHRWPSREFSWSDTRIARPISFLRSSHCFVQRCVTSPSRSCVWKRRDASKGPSRAFVCYMYTFTFVRVRLRNVFVRYVEARRHYLISWRCVTRMRDESNKSDRTSPRVCSRGLTEAHVHADLLMQFVIEISTVAMDPLRELRLSPIYVWIRIGSNIYSARETATNLRGVFLEYVIDFNRSCGRLWYGCFSSERGRNLKWMARVRFVLGCWRSFFRFMRI